jgi:hypothetical protein
MTVMTPGGLRFSPLMPAASYKTFAVVWPSATHWRSATCEEVGCRAWAYGWTTTVPAGSRLEHLVRTSGRHPTSEHTNPDGTISFVFAAGTACFESAGHRIRVRPEPLYVVRDGDWRGNPRGTTPRRHANARDFVDDFATHQDRLADRLRRG